MNLRAAQVVSGEDVPSLGSALGSADLTLRRLVPRHPSVRFVPAVLISVAMRARFLFTPITSDEGGFLAIARAWSSGETLYRDVWVDRPQGLLVLYRAWDALGLGSPVGIRLLALLACIVGAVACGLVAELLFGRRAGAIGAVLVAVLASVPQYEGFIANGELLSGAIGAAGLAVALRACWRRDEPSWGGLLAAGVLGGAAVSVKQSGFDATACAVAAVAWSSCHAPWTVKQRLAATPVLLAGFVSVVAAMALHGLATGWDRFWFAVVGYRMEQRSALHGAAWDRLADTGHIAAPALAPVCFVVLAGMFGRRSPLRPAFVMCSVWIAAAAAAFLSGGQFHRHYWVIFSFALGTAAAGVVSIVSSRTARVTLVLLLLSSPTWSTVRAIRIPDSEVGRALSDDGRLSYDGQIATWFEERAIPGDEIYALCAGAGLYGNLSIAAPFAYLWFDGVRSVPGAQDALVEMLTSPQRPRFIAQYQSASTCDPSGRVANVLREHYFRATTIDGISVLESRHQS